MTLKEYLSSYLGSLETQLGWSSTSYDSIVTDTQLQYGISSEEEATDQTKLYKLGVYYLWKKVYRELTLNFDYSADGASLKLSQQVENVKAQLNIAFSDAYPYLPNGRIQVIRRNNHISGSLISVDEFGEVRYVPYYSR